MLLLIINQIEPKTTVVKKKNHYYKAILSQVLV